jgi:arylsulfatase
VNIVLIMTDQQRADCLSCEGHPGVQTPAIDALAAQGSRFTAAHSACPICIAARRTWMTGRRPARQGVVFNYDTWLRGPTLPGVLSQNGYHCHLAGKLHLWPVRRLHGFHSMDLADGPPSQANLAVNDHSRDLARRGIFLDDLAQAHGIPGNSWHVRPWHLPEETHPTNWCISKAMDFLERRDPTRPFFLNVGIFHPHPPCTPPEFYYNRALAAEIPEPVEAAWSCLYDTPRTGFPTNMAGSSRLCLRPDFLRQLRAAYFASISHIDDQIQRLLQVLPPDTLVIFTSDHGEMLGDHQFFGKCLPYEPSARIPLVMRFPSGAGISGGQVVDAPVELMDLMPTVLDAAGIPVPEEVDGCSLLPVLRGEPLAREFIHGEISRVAGLGSGMHYLTDGKEKYIWWPGFGTEQFFDLRDDPRECHDLSSSDGAGDRLALWRQRLARLLEGRPEGFVEGGRLRKLGGATPYCLPGFEAPDSPGPTLHPDNPPPGFDRHPPLGSPIPA